MTSLPPTPPLDRFTDDARRTMSLALREALQLGHNYIGPEHLLLALIDGDENIATQALTDLNVRLTAARAQVIDVMAWWPTSKQRKHQERREHIERLQRKIADIQTQINTLSKEINS